MNDTLKKVAAGIAAAGTIAGGVVLVNNLNASKGANLNDYSNAVQMYNYEIKQLGRLTFSGDIKNITPYLNQIILGRTETKSVELLENGSVHTFTADEYMKYRNDLINKFTPQ